MKEIKEKEVWENFLLNSDEKTFLQSWNWGEFQKMMGNKIWRWGIYDNEQRTVNNEQLIGTAFFYKIQAKRGTFLFVPHGPKMKYEAGSMKYEVLKFILEELKKIAKEESVSFIRIAPILENNPARIATQSVAGGEENIRIFNDLGFREAPIHMHPELTWELDITPSEEELLIRMRKTTRYLTKQAQKNHDIQITQSQNIKDIEKFDILNQQTVDRHRFVPFPLDYLKNEFLAFNPDNQISIFFGKYKGEVISSGIFIFWQGIAFYHHGASSLKYPKIPVSYLLLWEAIREAKKRECKKFNFWGIAPVTSDFRLQTSEHPWAGLTLFKMGFGGYKKEYVKTQDLPLSNKYWLTYIFERIRRAKRGL